MPKILVTSNSSDGYVEQMLNTGILNAVVVSQQGHFIMLHHANGATAITTSINLKTFFDAPLILEASLTTDRGTTRRLSNQGIFLGTISIHGAEKYTVKVGPGRLQWRCEDIS